METLACSPWLDQFALIQPRTMLASSTSIIKKKKKPHRPYDGGILSIEASSSQISLACVKKGTKTENLVCLATRFRCFSLISVGIVFIIIHSTACFSS